MKLELHSASHFIIHLLRLHKCPISNYKLNQLWINLNTVLYRRYKSHWFVNKPNKGSAYRCIRCYETYTDALITEAGKLSKIPEITLWKSLPSELTLWIDPGEVYYRIDNGPIYVLYTCESQKAWIPTYSEKIRTDNLDSLNQLIQQIKALSQKVYQYIYLKKV